MKLTKILVLVLIAATIVAYFALDLGQYLSLPYLKDKQHAFQAYCAENPVKAIGAYFLLYVLLAALSIPGPTIATLAGGVLFGMWLGTAIVLFAASIGATMAFLVSRHLLQDWVRNRFRTQFDVVNERFSRDCVLYLLTLRLVPVFPFFIVNLLVGLTTMRIWPFYWASLLGMLPGTVVRVNAGTQLGQIAEWHDVMRCTVNNGHCRFKRPAWFC
ncbi:Uncharacterized membrane protein YdjX, TVP38/TMEM64 family, SNARE-associated domain [Noviherbaspirillum suwonense]|uniref:TVP38/TMEM64 family membrane protein n=2 Tax=Noviherbaspirillum suwonense TaxID=1224511 RepID=A0ABY1QVC3_9BURK|nr:Uncharacterized membrane protein YdjX, TVP38/TMEM64 family, SNARE-associated domain [Noviherbaspirillum suwonense]